MLTLTSRHVSLLHFSTRVKNLYLDNVILQFLGTYIELLALNLVYKSKGYLYWTPSSKPSLQE